MRSIQTKVILVATGLLAVSIILTGCGRGTIAKIDGRRISKQEYYNRLERLPYRDPQTGQSMDAGQAVLAQLIDEVLLQRMAEIEKIPPTDAQINERMAQAKKAPNFATELKRSGYTQDQVKEMLRVKQALYNLQTKDVKVDPGEIKAYYKQNVAAQFTQPENVEVAAIFAKDKTTADRAMKLLAGKTEFGTVAMNLSSDKNSAASGGLLPLPISRGDRRIPVSVQNVLFATKKGAYTQPIYDNAGGWAIFKIINHNNQAVRKFDEVKYLIGQSIAVNKGLQKKIDVQADLMKFRKKADIKVEIERYKASFAPPKTPAR